MEAVLTAKNLWSYIHTPTSFVEEKEELNQMHQCKAIILCSIEAQFIHIIAGKAGPKEMWETLLQAQKSKCTAKKHTLRRKLNTLKMKHNESIRDYANSICTLVKGLSLASYTLSEEDKIFALVNGLRNKFEIKKTILQDKREYMF